MNYLILHNDYPVCTVTLDEEFRIDSIREIHNRDRLSVGIREGEKVSAIDIDTWLFSRAIPEKREGLELILKKEKVKNNRELLVKNWGLGLNDHYWIREEGKDLAWGDVNFFEHDFGKIGEDIFIGKNEGKVDDARTPNGVSSGMLPKKWIIQAGERYLLKGSEDVYHQEPFNEAAASEFLWQLDVDRVQYDLVWYKKSAYSLCGNMLGNSSELVV